ncbi:MAG TPA: DinB family protein [Thermoanaerobaculia bacterium]
MTRDDILRRLDEVQGESAAYWGAFDAPAFFAKLGEAWSPAENVRHLVKSIRPVTKALGMPRLVLWVMFGRAKRVSVSYDALVERYHGLLEGGAKAGRFAPSAREEHDLEARRTEILGQQAEANRALRAAIARWPERALDRYQLPHPLLGKLTVREMLYFTLYHQLHHIGVVERRRNAGV